MLSLIWLLVLSLEISNMWLNNLWIWSSGEGLGLGMYFWRHQPQMPVETEVPKDGWQWDKGPGLSISEVIPDLRALEEERNPAVDVKTEQQIRKEEIPDNVVTWKPKAESISRRKEWSLAVSGTETPEVAIGFGNRRASSPPRGYPALAGSGQGVNGRQGMGERRDYSWWLTVRGKSHGVASGGFGNQKRLLLSLCLFLNLC